MFAWVDKHVHTIVAAVSVVGVVAATVAANTAGLLPASVGAWLSAAGTIIATVLAHVVIPPAAHKLASRRDEQ